MSLTEQEKLGLTLFHKRKELSLLQVDVAAMVDVEKPTISAYECGVVKNIALRTRLSTIRNYITLKPQIQRLSTNETIITIA